MIFIETAFKQILLLFLAVENLVNLKNEFVLEWKHHELLLYSVILDYEAPCIC